MKVEESALAPPVRLAIAYARADLRDALSLLLRFDDRIAGVVGRSSEPIIGQMKIAWWHDAIAKTRENRPRGEPLLIELNEIENEDVAGAMRQILGAWELLLAEEQWSPETLATFAEMRGEGLFGTYLRWIGENAGAGLARQWALDDLRQRFGSRVDMSFAQPPETLPLMRSLRPLTILALAATAPAGFRMTWHALTGR